MQREKIPIGQVTIPQGKEKWLRSVNKQGIVSIIEPGSQKYTPSQRAAVDDANKRIRTTFVTKAKKLRDAQTSAWQEFKKDPMNERLKTAFMKAKDERAAFDATRRPAELAAKREARQKALK